MATTTQSSFSGVGTDAVDAASLVSRERLLVGLAILSLLVAAFLLPPLGPAAGSGSGPGNETGQSEEPTTTETPSETEPTDRDGDGDLEGPPGGNGTGVGPGAGGGWVTVGGANGSVGDGGVGVNTSASEPHPDCFLVVWDRLVPGREASVVLWNDGGPVQSREVWFDGRSLGHTNADGRVDGRVPYVRQVQVTADAPPVERCGVIHLAADTGLDEWRDGDSSQPVLRVGEKAPVETVTPENGNLTATLPVEGEANLTVTGEPYPGEDVRLNATVAGEPMRSATVAVDGQRVGETGDGGRYTLTVPDDGRETVTVSVSRGEFGAERTVEVLLLTVDLQTVGVVALPGDAVGVTTRIGDRPAANVTVAGPGGAKTTGSEGRATVRLPSDPSAVVTATGYGQRATAPVWPLFLPTVAICLLAIGLVVGSVAAVARSETGPSTTSVAAIWGIVGILVAAWITAGPVWAGLVGLAALVVAGIYYREAVGRGLTRLRTAVGTATMAIHGLALRLADWLGRATDSIHDVLASSRRRLAGLPRSFRGLLGLAARWLAGLPRRGGIWVVHTFAVMGAETTSLARWLATVLVQPRALAALGLGAVFVGAGWILGGVPGGAAVVVVLLASVVAWIWRLRGRTAGRGDEHGPISPGGNGQSGSSFGHDEQPVRPRLRAFWRTFARWVVPGRWRTRTPGEIARVAANRGFPREPVERLTESFRAVEYGEQGLTDEEWDRARSAFEALRSARSGRSDEKGGDS